MINHNQGNPYKERIPPITCIYEDLPYKERPSPLRNECQLYAIIKTSKLSQTKVRIIYLSSVILELWKFFNLTFRGYLAGTTPVLSTRSSLFLFCRFCLEYVRTVRLTDDFWHHQLQWVLFYFFDMLFHAGFCNWFNESELWNWKNLVFTRVSMCHKELQEL